MSQTGITTCRICLEKFKQQGGNVSTPIPKLECNALNITENPVICKRCEVDYDKMDHVQRVVVKEEIKEEFVAEEESVLENCYQHNSDKQTLTDRTYDRCFKCNMCNYATADNLLLINHKQIHLNKGKITLERDVRDCLNIRKPTLQKIRCDCEILARTGRKSFNCKVCDFTSKLFDVFKAHRCEYNFSCYNCEYKTSSKCALVKHMIVHSKLFKCDFCDFSSKRPSTLKLHLESSDNNFNCDKCDYKSYSRCNFMSHKKVHSDNEKSKQWKKHKAMVNHRKNSRSYDTSTKFGFEVCHYKSHTIRRDTVSPANTQKT